MLLNRKNSAIGLGALFVLLLMVSPTVISANSQSSSSASIQPQGLLSAAPLISVPHPQVSCGDVHALCPSMLTTAYDMTTMQKNGITGKGQAVVIDDACGDPNIASDLQTFDSTFGLSNPKLNVYYPQGKNVCSDSGWSLETSLDVEWSHVVAPGATINVVVAASPNNDLYKAWNYSLANHLGNEISDSWGGGGNCPKIALTVLAAATKQHVSILASGGDSGAWGQNHGSNSQPADCQQVLSIGGTSLNVQSSGKYISESAWSSSGGGYVTGTKEPDYQSDVKITDSFNLLGKDDVSAVADPNTGVLVYNAGDGGWFQVGGTSVSCPLWAGFLADVNQVRAGHGFNPLGDVVPFLYTNIYGVSGSGTHYSKDFHDVTTGSDGWPAGKGWDVPTGIGTFIATPLASTLGSAKNA